MISLQKENKIQLVKKIFFSDCKICLVKNKNLFLKKLF
jgi:hypothetical protein